jgi:hypothetical protein
LKKYKLKVVYNEKRGGLSIMVVVSIEYGTLAIEVGLVLNLAVVFSSTYFLFRLEQTNYKTIGMALGKKNTKDNYRGIFTLMG